MNLEADSGANYVILEAEGRGHYVGCNVSVTNFQGTWWGEGDDMIFIDGETWPPSLHGTGSEDYFSQAWENQEAAYLMCGSSIFEGRKPCYQTTYRFHLVDPVRFAKSIRVTMEHGHGNHSANDWASTAYWYQTLPGVPFDIPKVQDRLPIRVGDLGILPMLAPGAIPPHPTPLTDEMRAMSAQHRAKVAGRNAEMADQSARRWAEAQAWSRNNAAFARDLRRRWLADES